MAPDHRPQEARCTPAPHMGLTYSHVGNSQTYLYLSSKQEIELKISLLLVLCFCLNAVYTFFDAKIYYLGLSYD